MKNCGKSCIFGIEFCPNSPCIEQYSRKWSQQHDAICPEKILPCTRQCGEIMPRKNMETHVSQECILRPVFCPYNCIGCIAPGLIHKDVPMHLEDKVQAHMELMLQRIMEQQSVIKMLHGSVESLEQQNAQTVLEMRAMNASLTTISATLSGLQAKQDKSLQSEIQKIDRKLSTSVDNLTTEVNSIKKYLRDQAKATK